MSGETGEPSMVEHTEALAAIADAVARAKPTIHGRLGLADEIARLLPTVERIVAARVEEAKAEALREAADEVERIQGARLPDGWKSADTSIAPWLRDRADQIKP